MYSRRNHYTGCKEDGERHRETTKGRFGIANLLFPFGFLLLGSPSTRPSHLHEVSYNG